MWSSFPLLPEQSSTIAASIDSLFTFMVVVSGFFSALIFILIFYFAIRYRRRPGHTRAVQIKGNLPLELFWTAVPFGLSVVMFTWGASLFMRNYEPPANALNIYVVGKQWMWKIQHPEGRREINELHVPVGRPVKLTLASQDVIHDFFVPAFRVKQDVVPGRYTTMWFQATKTGEYHLYCAQYCGTEHSKMIGKVVVMEPKDFQDWLAGGPEEPPAQAGEKLFSDFNCVNCHQAGAGQRCPPLEGLYGKPVRLQSGETVIFDDAYIRESITNPVAKVVAGYRPIMPTFRGQLTEEQIIDVIAYIKSLTPSGQQQ